MPPKITKNSKSDHDTQLARITDNAPVMLAEVDRNLIYRFVNVSYAALFGKTVNDLVGQSVKTVLGDTAFTKAEAQMREALKGNRVRYDLTLPRSDDLGRESRQFLDVSYSPHFNEKGEVTSFIAGIIDKTSEGEALRQIDELSSKLRTAHDLSLHGFAVIRAIRSDDNKIIDFSYFYANSKAEEIGGTFLVGHRLLELFPGNIESGLFDAYVRVVETGETFIKELYYEHDGLSFWLEISAIKLGDGCALSFEDISDRKKTEAHNRLLLNELQHRVKNTLATVQSMALQTANRAKTIEEFAEKFQPRLRSISKAHDILLQSETGRASLKTMINQQLRPYVAINSDQLKLKGTDALLSESSAHALGLIIHELATNACKYGALSNNQGLVQISWHKEEKNVYIVWEEIGGPKVKPPRTRGFGSLLIEESLKYGLGGNADLHFNPQGLKVNLKLPLD